MHPVIPNQKDVSGMFSKTGKDTFEKYRSIQMKQDILYPNLRKRKVVRRLNDLEIVVGLCKQESKYNKRIEEALNRAQGMAKEESTKEKSSEPKNTNEKRDKANKKFVCKKLQFLSRPQDTSREEQVS